jgi:hypothetical protein
MIYWDGSYDNIDIEFKDYNKFTDYLEYNFLSNDNKTLIPSNKNKFNKIK